MEEQRPDFENIWLADDDKDDCALFEEVLKQILPSVTLTLSTDREELMKELTIKNMADLLFLDINMPCKNGLDCLKDIRAKTE